jgi:hypothetical protein
MAQSAPAQPEIPTRIPQPAPAGSRRPPRGPAPGKPAARRQPRGARVQGDTRTATRGEDRPVIELACGITVYPAREDGGRWRAVWYENGERRQCEASTEDRLAARLEKVTVRLAADAPNMERPGADLIAHYLDPDRPR